MCRWMAWLGQPVLIEELLFNTQHGIVDQSLHSRMGAETTNGDGFGLGWYGAGAGPGLYHSVAPAWCDANLRELAGHVESPLFLAHVRAAIGSPVQQTNCHPFRHGNWLLRPQRLRGRPARAPARPHARDRPGALRRRQRLDRHRGRLPARAHPRARGGPHRRDGADRRLHRGDRRARTGSSGLVQGTFGISDGETLWAIRYATEGTARTLFASADVDAIHRLYPDNARLQPPRRGRPADRLRAVRRPAGRLAGDRAVERGDGALRRRPRAPGRSSRGRSTVPSASGPQAAGSPGD